MIFRHRLDLRETRPALPIWSSFVKEKQALDARLANLVQANEDARAFSTEGN